MYRYFENLIDPLAAAPVEKPPAGTAAFFRHYLWPVRRLLFVTLLLSSIASIAELYLYAYLGVIVDWMASTPPDDFFRQHGNSLWLMFFIVAVLRPVCLVASRCLITLTLTPGITNTVRWQNHRWVVRQSLGYFQNDFAGRVAQKVMQTGVSLRECVLNVVDGVWLLLIYLVGIVWLFMDIDSRLMVPVAAWVIGYVLVI